MIYLLQQDIHTRTVEDVHRSTAQYHRLDSMSKFPVEKLDIYAWNKFLENVKAV